MRERVEDLGRISVMIDNILDSEIFSFYSGRRKDFVEYFEGLSQENKEDTLRTLIYGIESISDSLYKILEIANGYDNLNSLDV